MREDEEMKAQQEIRLQIGLEGSCGERGLRVGLAAEVFRYTVAEPPRPALEGPEIVPCVVPHRGSNGRLPRRSGDTADGGDHE